jgi:hypothetical protein
VQGRGRDLVRALDHGVIGGVKDHQRNIIERT